ncbi:MAG: hypothetical protein JSR80_07830 [Verrucomicrobia bacterium]|nr:hypothetical protein [Verrucomicrobiota bacterium]
MGNCDVNYANRGKCANCPFKPKFGCCKILDGTDSCARTSYFAALAISSLLPHYAQRLKRFIENVSILRDVIEISNCFKDYIGLVTGELFDSSCPIDQASSTTSLAASIVTPLPILAERGLLPLQLDLVKIAPLAKFLSALGHGFAIFSALTKDKRLNATDSSCECAYQLSELAEAHCPAPIILGVGIATGCWKATRTFAYYTHVE